MRRAFTVSIADMREERYRGSGAGGQNRNKRDTGVRLTHEPSGAIAECEQERSQLQNRRAALEKIAKNPRFVAWARAEVAARAEGFASVERKVDALMEEKNLCVEVNEKCVPNEAYCDVDKGTHATPHRKCILR